MNSQLNSLTMRPALPTGLVAKAEGDPRVPVSVSLRDLRAPHPKHAR